MAAGRSREHYSGATLSAATSCRWPGWRRWLRWRAFPGPSTRRLPACWRWWRSRWDSRFWRFSWSAQIINLIVVFFRGVPSQGRALKVATYAFTPLWVGAVFIALPALSVPVLFLAGLYHTYLMYMGLKVLMKSPARSRVGLRHDRGVVLGHSVHRLHADQRRSGRDPAPRPFPRLRLSLMRRSAACRPCFLSQCTNAIRDCVAFSYPPH